MPSEALNARFKVARSRGGDFSLDVAFTVPPGITILFGPSGSGKSTTLAAIAGLVRPDQGMITLGSEIWFDADKRIETPVHRRGVAFVFQSLALFPHLTALANVAYGIDRRRSKSERRHDARAMLERMKVGHLADRHPPTFSGGEAQRVALARAFAMSPKIVLLDEAFSAMDRELRRELASDVRRYVDEAKLPVLQVTHHRNEARAMGDRAILIEGGRVKAEGTVDAMLPEIPPGAAGNPFDEMDRTPLPRL
jgi:molybdate transport system ATP-binding protein